MKKSVKVANDVLAKEENKKHHVIKFKTTFTEMKLIDKIVTRAKGMDNTLDIMSVNMDITACHCNGTPLDLQKLLDADDFNFVHDVYGIARHINRRTGKIENCFLPRCSQ